MRRAREDVMHSAFRTIAFACLAALALPASGALAQAWPTRPISFIVPFPAGGSVDLIARSIASELSEKFGQQFIIDNRSGAGGNIGGAAVAKASPDGYTFLFGTPGPMATNKLMYKNLQYDPERDLTPVVHVSQSPLVIVASPATPAKDLRELIAYARANPDKVNVGVPGNGTIGHITSVLLQRETGTRMVNVPYRGSGPLITDLVGGQVDVSMDFMSAYLPLITEGKLRALAVTTRTRARELPDTMTVQEAGFAGFEATAWYAIAAPTGTPPDIVAKVNGAVNDYLRSEKGRQRLDIIGMQPVGGTPDDLKAYIASELKKWGPIVKAANIVM
jgi:tripartite-type tricarboxylate transporter receptor subunit TctC